MGGELDKYTLPLGSTVIEAIEAIKNNRSRCVVVMQLDRVVGVLSEGDIMAALLRDTDVHAPVADHVHRNFKWLPTRNMHKALDMMRRFGLTLVPIVDSDLHLTGVITLGDVLSTLVAPDESHE